MTETLINISVKVPSRIVERLPAPGNGRSRFIVQSLEDTIERQAARKTWKPVTQRGHKLAALLAKGKAERLPLLNAAQFDKELAERRGRQF